jgi:hypothetical protein
MNASPSSKSRRLINAASQGWQSAKANLGPALIIIIIAALIVIAYYQFPAVSASLEGLVKFRQQMGAGFAMAASAIGAGIIPGLYLSIAGRSRKGPRGAIDLLFTCLVWAVTAFALDRFYIFQAWLWGSAVNARVLIGKMLIDQLIFSPLIGIQIPAIGFRLRELNYDLYALGRAFREDWIIRVTVPLLIACWLTWVPGSLVIYSLPLPLQIPMMALIQCFFALEVAYASARM